MAASRANVQYTLAEGRRRSTAVYVWRRSDVGCLIESPHHLTCLRAHFRHRARGWLWSHCGGQGSSGCVSRGGYVGRSSSGRVSRGRSGSGCWRVSRCWCVGRHWCWCVSRCGHGCVSGCWRVSRCWCVGRHWCWRVSRCGHGCVSGCWRVSRCWCVGRHWCWRMSRCGHGCVSGCWRRGCSRGGCGCQRSSRCVSWNGCGRRSGCGSRDSRRKWSC